jgi:hypothetical protein
MKVLGRLQMLSVGAELAREAVAAIDLTLRVASFAGKPRSNKVLRGPNNR